MTITSPSKTCTKCLQEKPYSEFTIDNSKKNNIYSACKVCVRNYQRELYSKTEYKIKRRVRDLKKKYGITEKEYHTLLQKSNWSCSICGLHEINLQEKHPKSRGLHVDHNHDNGKVRGLLCQNCNSLLGQARDKIEILESAIHYLKKHAS